MDLDKPAITSEPRVFRVFGQPTNLSEARGFMYLGQPITSWLNVYQDSLSLSLRSR